MNTFSPAPLRLASVVVGVLVFALFFMFRPAANAFVDKRSGDVWEGVE